MGNSNSTNNIRNNNGRRNQQQQQDQTFAYWIGRQLHSPQLALPTCWDELIDWTDDASMLLQIYLNNKNNRRRRRRREEKKRLLQQGLDNNNNNKNDTIKLQNNKYRDQYKLDITTNNNDGINKKNEEEELVDENELFRTLKLVPYVAIDQRHAIHNLPSLSYVERAKFYAENVSIIVVSNRKMTVVDEFQRPKHLPIPGTVLTVGRFVHIYTLLTRYTDLLGLVEQSSEEEEVEVEEELSCLYTNNNNNDNDDLLLHHPHPGSSSSSSSTHSSDTGDGNNNKKENNTNNNYCILCVNEYPNSNDMVVLSCSHKLCRKCTKTWVTRKLNCPFCRQTFTKENVIKSQWQVLEDWSSFVREDNKSINTDIQRLEQQITGFWKNNTITTTLYPSNISNDDDDDDDDDDISSNDDGSRISSTSSSNTDDDSNMNDDSSSVQDGNGLLLQLVPGYVCEGRTIPPTEDIDDMVVF